MNATAVRTVLTPATLLRLLLPWIGVAAASLAAPLLAPPASLTTLVVALVAIVGVILIAAFGVVSQAEHLAHSLGEPYGTLILTLSVVIIEVVLIASVMLGPGEHASIARDSVTAVMMIIMGLVLGACLVVGGIRHPRARHNRVGTGLYVTLIAVFVAVSLILPAALGAEAFAPLQAVIVSVLVVAVYAWFLMRQTGPQASDFRDRTPAAAPARTTPKAPAAELVVRTVVLVATMLPIVLLGHSLATVLDDLLGQLDAPAALSGVVIAFIVFTPETITMIRAAAGGEPQRVANLGLGAFVSTLGLTIPSVLVIGLLTGQDVPLAESPAMIVVLIATIFATAVTYAGKRTTAVHGAVHLALFGAYLLVLLG